jgi:hypothetical protein
VALEQTRPRPTLRLGEEVVSESDALALAPAADTRMRVQFAAPGQLPERFPPVRQAGAGVSWRSEKVKEVGDDVLWLALQPQADAGGARRHGYLVSWSRVDGWCFRGYFAEPGVRIELGCVRQAEPLPDGERRAFVPVFLDEGGQGFTLTLGDGEPRWGGQVPPGIESRVTGEQIDAWWDSGLSPAHCPEALRAYQSHFPQVGEEVQTIEFTDAGESSASRLQIRVWRPVSTDALAAWDRAGAVVELAAEVAEPPAAPPPAALPPAVLPSAAPPAASAPASPPVSDAAATDAEPAAPTAEPEVLGLDDPPEPEVFE